MATESITKDFVIETDEAAERFLKVMTEPPTIQPVKSDAFEKGEEVLKRMLSQRGA